MFGHSGGGDKLWYVVQREEDQITGPPFTDASRRNSQYYYHTFLSAPSLALESTRSSESQDLSRFTWVVLQLRSLGNW